MLTTVGLILGYTCNSKCRHCLWGDTLQDESKMSFEDVCHYIDSMSELQTAREVIFSGGEPFLFRDVMTEGISYAYRRYNLSAAVTTNSFWATSRQQAQDVLGDLCARGLRRMQTSVDDFHQEYVPFERAANAVHAAIDLKIKCTVIVVATNKSKRRDYYVNALEIDSADDVDVLEVQATPVGYASSRIDRSDYALRGEVPADICAVLEAISILPDGSVQVCCGPPLPSKELNAGNARSERLADIIARAEWNPIFNALSLAKGPAILVNELEKLGKHRDLQPGYASPCDACQHILSGLKLGPELEAALGKRQAELYFLRLLADTARAENNNKTPVLELIPQPREACPELATPTGAV
jgi:organic radical activating enzyme